MRSFAMGLLVLAASAPLLGGAPTNDEETLRRLNREWIDAEVRKDIPKVMTFYAEDAVIYPPNAPEIRGTDAIHKFIVDSLTPMVRMAGGPTSIIVAASGDLAFNTGWYKVTVDTPQGKVDDEGKFYVVWRKKGGEWKAIGNGFSSNKPAVSGR